MEPVKTTLAVSISLFRAIDKILAYADEHNKPIPANVKYKLLRCRGMLEKDYLFFEEKRVETVKKYGKESDNQIRVEEDKMEEFRTELLEVVNKEVSHTFDLKLKPEDVDYLTADNLLSEELNLLMVFLIDDPALFEEATKGTSAEVTIEEEK